MLYGINIGLTLYDLFLHFLFSFFSQIVSDLEKLKHELDLEDLDFEDGLEHDLDLDFDLDFDLDDDDLDEHDDALDDDELDDSLDLHKHFSLQSNITSHHNILSHGNL